MMKIGPVGRVAACGIAGAYVGVSIALCFTKVADADELHPAPLGAPTAYSGTSSTQTFTSAAIIIRPFPSLQGDDPILSDPAPPVWWGKARDRDITPHPNAGRLIVWATDPTGRQEAGRLTVWSTDPTGRHHS
jgi:hypothetical protein